ncbi:hypothetical protein [Actinoplanes friuliensis]|uniref:Uncharacterized protein n=1 Tax=Actinoplanes friuliensis DSM 7358 TaxID=1246995 RepID=U5W339_9ACTN|nr:hypothetical protein [Actinoplanes friuliensis]AGZ43432.1 hypothetical protein AFR_25840 [Actinoplanes friuliensis DSM 7358]
MELTLPATPVVLPPGVAVRVPVELHNPGPGARDVRLVVARGRAAGWAAAEPPATTVAAGAAITVELVLQTPHDQPPSASLVPFTVRAEDLGTGATAGFASGLLTVAVPVPVRGELVPRPGAAQTFDLHLGNDGAQPADVRVSAELDPPSGTTEIEPATAQVEPGGSLPVSVRARPARSLIGTPKKYAVIVTVHGPGPRPLLSAVGTGVVKPLVPKWVAAVVAVVLALGATAGVLLPRLSDDSAAPAVGRPFALVEAVPHTGGDGGRAAADARLATLTAAGMPVRLVDSLTSDDLDDNGGAGSWLLLHDGFGSADAATSFCTQWQAVAPGCKVVP